MLAGGSYTGLSWSINEGGSSPSFTLLLYQKDNYTQAPTVVRGMLTLIIRLFHVSTQPIFGTLCFEHEHRPS